MPVNNSSDSRINSRSPYFIEAGRAEPADVVIPDPVENNTPPTVTIVASNEKPTVGQTITLTAVATDSDGTVVAYQWGGGETTTEISVTSQNSISITYFVTVTDDDGDTASDSITIHWQEVAVEPSPDATIVCGQDYFEGPFVGTMTYLLDVGEKIGDITIQLNDVEVFNNNMVPVKFDLDWNGNTATSGYVGHNEFGCSADDGGADNTGLPSTKATPTTVVVNKTSATPTFATLTAKVITCDYGGGQTFSQANDSYGFRLVCPDTTSPEMYYYTLINDCPTGDSEVTYTDVNGNTVTVTLAQGETQLISAQENSVIETVCQTTIDDGGESFDDKGVPDQTIDNKTELTILFDDSGSMNKTLTPLQSMARGKLKDTLISIYGSQAEYEKRVEVITASFFISKYATELDDSALSVYGTISPRNRERFLGMVKQNKRHSDSTKSVFLVFTDEVDGPYNFSFTTSDYSGVTTNYISDLSAYRTFLNSINYGEHFVKLFNVDYTKNPSVRDIYNNFLFNIFNGQNGFYGSRGLSDRSEANIHSELVINGSSPDYYHDLIINALREFGFNI
jgi:hypothetical protein